MYKQNELGKMLRHLGHVPIDEQGQRSGCILLGHDTSAVLSCAEQDNVVGHVKTAPPKSPKFCSSNACNFCMLRELGS